MKKTIKKSFNQKIIIAVITVLTLNFAIPNYCHAGLANDVGGILVSPIVGFFATLTDVANILIGLTVTAGDFDVPYIITTNGKKEFLQKQENQPINEIGFPTKKINTKDVDNTQKDYVAVNIGDFGVPNIIISPAEIFSNKVTLLNANYFTEDYARGVGDEKVSIVKRLKETIASWYNTFRMISIVSLLSILVYVGIRIILSSTANGKAKYKSMFMDWLVALCLIFFFHYIMVFTMTFVDNITEAIAGPGGAKQVNVEIYDGNSIANVDGVEAKFATNLAGLIRLETESKGLVEKMTALIMYIAITGYTAYFLFAYLKRFMTLTFLTLIAPLVSLTYPLDKIKDSKAQAFQFWLKEYIFNAILPIIHLILYTVFVTAAIDLVVDAPLYAIAALAFILPAEKIVKNMFGIKSDISIGKAAVNGALASQAISQGTKLAKSFMDKKSPSAGQNKLRTTEIPSTSDKPTTQVRGEDIDALGDATAQAHVGAEVARQSENDGSADSSSSTTTETNNASGTNNPTPENSNGQGETSEPNNSNETSGTSESNNSNETSGANNQNSLGQPNGRRDSVTGFVRPTRLKRSKSSRIRGALNLPKGHEREAIKRGARKLAIKGAKTYAKAGMVLGAAMIGLGTGMVGDDMGDMFTGALGGIAAGSAVAGVTEKRMSQKLEERTRKRRIKKYGEAGAKAIEQNEKDKDFMLNQKNRQHVIDKFNINENDTNTIDKYLKDYCAYQRAGVTDMKQMDRMHDIQDELKGQGYKEENAKNAVIAAYNLSSNISQDAYSSKQKYDDAVAMKKEQIKDRKDANGKQKYDDKTSEQMAENTVKLGGRIRGYF